MDMNLHELSSMACLLILCIYEADRLDGRHHLPLRLFYTFSEYKTRIFTRYIWIF